MAADVVLVTDASGLIDPSLFPKESNALGLEWAEEQARFSRSTGQRVAESVQGVHSAWSRLPEDYQAPEAGDLYRVMDPELGAALREQERFLDAARYLDDYVDEVGAVKQRLANVEVEAATFRARVRAANPGGVTTMQLQELDTVDQNRDLIARAQRVFAVIGEAEQRCAERIRALDEQIAPVVSGLGPALTGGTGLFSSTGAWSPVGSPSVAPFAPTRAILDGSASEVREWWDTLTAEQRTALVAALPMVIGNLNGVPVKFRADANRINLATEINRLEAEKARIEKELSIAAMASRFSSARGQYVPDLRLASEVNRLQAAIDSYEQYRGLDKKQNEYDENGRKTYRDSVELVAFDPTSSSIATYRGPYDENGDVPDWVDNVAVHIPGTTTRMDDFNEIDTDVYNLYDAANRIKSAGSTAVFAWAGGEFPQNIPEAASASYSRDLGPKLLDFIHAIDVHPDSTLTAEAHSYGSAALGIAESEGLRVDRVMYVAGAGLGNDNTSVQDFPYTKDVPHYTQMARRDSVVGLIQGADAGELGHGASALRDPEVTRLETGYLNPTNRSEGDIESTGVFESHSAVYTRGSTSFNNIVGVFTGTRVEVYAGDEVLVAGGKLYNIDGIDVEGYVPRYVDVE
ncbi:alpha/beta hydrolase [Promicromonospora sp. NPDC023805]|uniref:alpha/beta hydrolase n=1 Tax=Promicromonospora sp. NPDC023805 TaxID=3154696 RepID=UPI0033DB429C